MKRLLLSILILMFYLNVFSQESSVYIGYKSMREVNTSYDYFFGHDFIIGGTIGYIFPVDDERDYGNIFPEAKIISALTRKQNQQGVSLSTFLKFIKGKRGRLILALSLEYQYLKSGNYINHTPGFTSSYPRINGGEYSEFKHTYNNFAFLFGIHHPFLKYQTAEIYFECGIAYKYIERVYSIDGYYDNRWASSRIELLSNLTPTFRIGMNFRILSFGDKNTEPSSNEKFKAKDKSNSKSKVKLM